MRTVIAVAEIRIGAVTVKIRIRRVDVRCVVVGAIIRTIIGSIIVCLAYGGDQEHHSYSDQ